MYAYEYCFLTNYAKWWGLKFDLFHCNKKSIHCNKKRMYVYEFIIIIIYFSFLQIQILDH